MNTNRPALTVVIGFRDRDVSRVTRCLDSLQRQTFQDFVVHLVDYGSEPDNSEALARAVAGYGFCELTRTETRGYPWNRSQALNVGGRLARSEYVMTTDIDMVFSPVFLEEFMARTDHSKALYCYHHFLPEEFEDWEDLDSYRGKLPTASEDALGACQCISTEVFHQIGGFDEYYRYWGVEDRDIHRRLMHLGLSEVWMNDVVAMYHQWHPTADVKTRGFMPLGHWARMQSHYYRYADEIERNDSSWGEILTIDDRPVFRYLDFKSMSLNTLSELVIFEARVNNERDAGRVVREFSELPTGHAIAVRGANLPGRSVWLDRIMGGANRLLRYAGRSSQVDYSANVLHSSLAEFLDYNQDDVRDYYLGFPDGDGVSILLRA